MNDDAGATISLFLDDASVAFATYRPPASCTIDTTQLADGPHTLHLRARDSLGTVGVRSVPFVVQNGPGITVTGLRAGEHVRGAVTIAVNAFGANEPFDPVRAESSAPIPVWTWVMSALIAAWAGWYGLTQTRAPEGVFKASAPMHDGAPAVAAGGAVAGFDYAKRGEQQYTANCAACHGASGGGVPGAFPTLVGDGVVVAGDPRRHIAVILHGLHGAPIAGTTYAAQMPAFAQLSDDDIAAIVDHERTSWGNRAPLATPGDVRALR